MTCPPLQFIKDVVSSRSHSGAPRSPEIPSMNTSIFSTSLWWWPGVVMVINFFSNCWVCWELLVWMGNVLLQQALSSKYLTLRSVWFDCLFIFILLVIWFYLLAAQGQWSNASWFCRNAGFLLLSFKIIYCSSSLGISAGNGGALWRSWQIH